MKAKLLKKLRKRFVIEKRNNEYRLLDIGTKSEGGGDYYQTPWFGIRAVIVARRDRILKAAQYYKTAKEYLR